MKLNGYEVINLSSALTKVTDDSREAKSTKVKYKALKLAQTAQDELKPFYTVRDEMLKKYGTEMENDPGRYQISPENIGTFNKEVDDILKEESSANFSITEDMFESFLDENVNFTNAELLTLEKMAGKAEEAIPTYSPEVMSE